MARKSGSALVQEELYPAEAPQRERVDDSRLLDLEAEQESPFLRAQKRVSVRKNAIPKKTAKRLGWVVLALCVAGVAVAAASALYGYGKHSWRFRIDSSDQIEISGAQHVSHGQIMEVMGGDIGRNIFFIPLEERQRQLEQIPWVESASVMRFVPNRLRIAIHERTPVAFVRIGSHIALIDAGGTLMEFTPGSKRKYSFPVIDGMNAGEPLSVRAARMKNYNALVRELDSNGAHYSQELSEVDLSDPEDVKVLVTDPNGDVLVHLGIENYLQRYKIYIAHVQQWRQQFEKLESVDLRYDGQIIVNPDLKGLVRQPALSPVLAKAAIAAGVKPASLARVHAQTPRTPPRKAALRRKRIAAKWTHRPAMTAASKPAASALLPSKAPVNHAAAASPMAGKTSMESPGKPPDSRRAFASSNAPAPAAHPVKPPAALPATTTNTSLKKPSPAIPKENAR